jgi:hypothetical protein
MTLPEVLVAVTILAIIIVPLADALIGFIRNTDATTRRMNESHDVQLATTYFGRDIQNLGVHDWTSPTLPLLQSIDNTDPGFSCTGPGTPVLRLAWDDPTTASGPPAVTRVTYLVRDVGTEHQLRRLLCRQPSIVDSDIVVVHNLFGPPVRSCLPSCTGAGAAAPQQVTLTLNIKDPASSTATTVILTGQRGQT